MTTETGVSAIVAIAVLEFIGLIASVAVWIYISKRDALFLAHWDRKEARELRADALSESGLDYQREREKLDRNHYAELSRANIATERAAISAEKANDANQRAAEAAMMSLPVLRSRISRLEETRSTDTSSNSNKP